MTPLYIYRDNPTLRCPSRRHAALRNPQGHRRPHRGACGASRTTSGTDRSQEPSPQPCSRHWPAGRLTRSAPQLPDLAHQAIPVAGLVSTRLARRTMFLAEGSPYPPGHTKGPPDQQPVGEEENRYDNSRCCGLQAMCQSLAGHRFQDASCTFTAGPGSRPLAPEHRKTVAAEILPARTPQGSLHEARHILLRWLTDSSRPVSRAQTSLPPAGRLLALWCAERGSRQDSERRSSAAVYARRTAVPGPDRLFQPPRVQPCQRSLRHGPGAGKVPNSRQRCAPQHQAPPGSGARRPPAGQFPERTLRLFMQAAQLGSQGGEAGIRTWQGARRPDLTTHPGTATLRHHATERSHTPLELPPNGGRSARVGP